MSTHRWRSSNPQGGPRAVPPDDGDATFDWEFDTASSSTGSVPPGPQPRRHALPGPTAASPPLRSGAAAQGGELHVQAVAQRLDGALEAWWRDGTLPPSDLLRDGLYVLEAGYDLPDAQRSLLLRAALHTGRGQVTALRHQPEPERVVLMVAEAALVWEPPLGPEMLARLVQADPRSHQWLPLLLDELRVAALGPASVARGRARLLVQHLAGETLVLEPRGAPEPLPPRGGGLQWGLRRRLLLAALVVTLGVWLVWQQARRSPAEMVEIAPGAYTVRDPSLGAGERLVTLDGFVIDRFEVTNAQYARCVARGRCPELAHTGAGRLATYATDPAFAQFPVVNVSWAAADAYCRWRGRRLPTAEEWEVAAGYAAAINRRQIYPWGDLFSVQRANSAAGGREEPVAVGSFRPGGDSPAGAADMAGNVAEWTSTWAQPEAGGQAVGGYVVKGGSYADDAAALQVTAQAIVAAETARADLGFRCARTVLLAQR